MTSRSVTARQEGDRARSRPSHGVSPPVPRVAKAGTPGGADLVGAKPAPRSPATTARSTGQPRPEHRAHPGLNTGSPRRVSQTELPSRMSALASVRQPPAAYLSLTPPGGHIQNWLIWVQPSARLTQYSAARTRRSREPARPRP